MRVAIAHLVTSLNVGGTERQLLELARGLAGLYRLKLFCFRPTGMHADEFRALGLAPMAFPLRGTLLRPNTLAVIRRIADNLRRERVDLLHCHDTYAVLIGVPAAHLAAVPVIASRRDLGHQLTTAQWAALRSLLPRATRVLCNSLTVAAHAERELGIATERLAVVPNGIDLRRFDERATSDAGAVGELPGSPDAPTVVTVARMTYPIKGHEDLLRAVPLVARHWPRVRFLIVGDGPREMEMRSLAEHLGVAPRVHFLGRRTDVPSLLGYADVACHPARMEGLPNAVMEAMAAARPIVATSVGGVPELIKDGLHGLLTPPAHPDLLADAVCRLLADADLARQLGAAARERVATEFSLDKLVTRTSRLYDSLTGQMSDWRTGA